MSRQDTNAAFALTSFLDGANARYVEDLYARFAKDPAAVDAQWQAFFKSLKDDGARARAEVDGPSWKRRDWPLPPRDDLTAALDSDWGGLEKGFGDRIKAKAQGAGVEIGDTAVQQAARDSVRAIMLIRAYRMRGHLHAKLDPLDIANPIEDYNELSPASYGFTEADYDRKIFIDHVLGLEYATIREMLDILQRTYCSTIGVEFMHISNPEEKAWIQERIEGKDKEIAFTREGKRAILSKLVEARASRSSATSSSPAPSVSVLTARNR